MVGAFRADIDRSALPHHVLSSVLTPILKSVGDFEAPLGPKLTFGKLEKIGNKIFLGKTVLKLRKLKLNQ